MATFQEQHKADLKQVLDDAMTFVAKQRSEGKAPGPQPIDLFERLRDVKAVVAAGHY